MTTVVRLELNPPPVVHVESSPDPIVRIVGVTAAGPAGTAGPVLPNLKGFVRHDADPTVDRPSGYLSVEWYGSVLPDNIDQDFDTWIDSS